MLHIRLFKILLLGGEKETKQKKEKKNSFANAQIATTRAKAQEVADFVVKKIKRNGMSPL